MSDSTTIARPYAKAIFEYALGEKKLAEWSAHLRNLAQAVLIPEAENFIANPATTAEQHIELLHSAIGAKANENKPLSNLIDLLAANKRLMLLPDIYALYEAHRAEQEKTLNVDVCSYSDLSSAQQQRLIESLSQRLQRKVSLKISIDPSLLGGAIIRAGDLVIDGSVRGKLNKLSTELAA
ncbi:F0F1 ATP synthase subunit delta [Fluoribacter dumoffii]|uniref:ATP synthase subunit delta n=1 Tax=Fluoribacter dumoffii TaxID=463 RepID=A0A377GEF4_9GAMM|nr:F0F1 ATP synthase subunit delta [Fluoribacter dumoffii]KTC91471.1 ATP synthase F1 subunit delta [Fluoribacter dumoffii NY 23]MCW8387407.1 F0F1 ATP synthase subunit delta [Fluoribacter dumoffii]MCW8417085.1 F0F1 ATP synthase subunit delta [Fluoribacter dumoffii]MCW8455075.1 F0F1 ATP synthase subunit delta [Fluoribacter dumoffii]MCW8460848.1 F0F1 ATP synthase subunit delta [Fluoribacter dumoffii]